MTIEDLDFHYQLQSEWTKEYRQILYKKIALTKFKRIVDFGCGTGCISYELQLRSNSTILAVDRDAEAIAFARKKYSQIQFLVADEDFLLAEKMKFDLILLNFVLLWQKKPVVLLKKLKRLLSENGVILICAEPDYGARVDYPEKFDFLKDFFAKTILQQNGDPFIGRKLKMIAASAGLESEVGAFCYLFRPETFVEKTTLREWKIWAEWGKMNTKEMKNLITEEKKAIAKKERIIFSPLFYAICKDYQEI